MTVECYCPRAWVPFSCSPLLRSISADIIRAGTKNGLVIGLWAAIGGALWSLARLKSMGGAKKDRRFTRGGFSCGARHNRFKIARSFFE
jgi:hypothetical protein